MKPKRARAQRRTHATGTWLLVALVLVDLVGVLVMLGAVQGTGLAVEAMGHSTRHACSQVALETVWGNPGEAHYVSGDQIEFRVAGSEDGDLVTIRCRVRGVDEEGTPGVEVVEAVVVR